MLRNAKLEAMGKPPVEPKPRHDRPQMATDEIVCLLVLPQEVSHSSHRTGYGAFQKTDAQIARSSSSFGQSLYFLALVWDIYRTVMESSVQYDALRYIKNTYKNEPPIAHQRAARPRLSHRPP